MHEYLMFKWLYTYTLVIYIIHHIYLNIYITIYTCRIYCTHTYLCTCTSSCNFIMALWFLYLLVCLWLLEDSQSKNFTVECNCVSCTYDNKLLTGVQFDIKVINPKMKFIP